jgi:hypothetical protein
MMQMVEFGYAMHELSSITKEEGMGTFHWVIWLLDRLEAHDDKTQIKPHLHQKDWVP